MRDARMLSISSAVDLAEGLPLIDHPVRAFVGITVDQHLVH